MLPQSWAACLIVTLILLSSLALEAHVPVPDSVLNPRTAAEAWNVIRLSTANVERLLREDRLTEAPDQISLCSPALRTLMRLAVDSPPDQRAKIAALAVRAAVAVSSFAQGCVAGDKAFAAATFEQLRGVLHELGSLYDPKTVNAEIYFCPMHPEFCSADPAARCDKCGMNLSPRRIPYSFVYVPPGEPTIRLSAKPDAPLKAGRGARVIVQLNRRDGSPVLLSDLLVMHTQPIHLLIVNAELADYHHEHPTPTGAPGEYAFAFTPTTNLDYRVFADLAPAATGVQEYTFDDLPSEAKNPPSAPPSDNSFVTSAGGLSFRLTLEGGNDSPIKALQAKNLHITVEDAAGKPVQRLEPVMNAFAHLVGFYEDRRTVVHLHPAGGEVLNPNLRGGPDLDFKFYPPKPGPLRLYCQVSVDGRMIFAAFQLNVSP